MWIANVSNGAVITEDEIPIIPNGDSPWLQLLSRCRNDKLKITGLRLGVGPALTNALSNKLCDGYWQGYEIIKIVSVTSEGSVPDRHRQGIGSIIGDKVFITWMELGSNGLTYMWQDIRPLEQCARGNTLDL